MFFVEVNFAGDTNGHNPAEERFRISARMPQENQIKGLIVLALLFLFVAAVSEWLSW